MIQSPRVVKPLSRVFYILGCIIPNESQLCSAQPLSGSIFAKRSQREAEPESPSALARITRKDDDSRNLDVQADSHGRQETG
jgi:hypothetical protein